MADDDIGALEEWRPVPIPEYADLYEVSNLGRVRRSAPSPSRRACNVKVGRVLKPGGKHYAMVRLCHNGRICPVCVHKLVALAFIGPPPTRRHQLAHGNGIKKDNRADNLRWATCRQNTEDTRKHGGLSVGERSHMAKLKADDVRAIRALRDAGGLTLAQIGERYGVGAGTVWHIVHRRNWKHLT